MNKFSIITPTGDRPEAFKLCCHYIKRQTIKPTEWIIIDDGNIKLNIPDWSFIKYIKRQKQVDEPAHTLVTQIREAFSFVSTEKVLFIEDDDWYSPNYCEIMSNHLDLYDAVGLTENTYYYIKSRQFFFHNNMNRSSLCSSAFSQAFLAQCIYQAPPDKPYVDMYFWKRVSPNSFLFKDSSLVLGIKQLPGRVGCTYDANQNILKPGMQEDSNLSFFADVIGEDIKLYERFF